MRFALFYQSVISDWNHGNAHFLRGLMRALQARGHEVICYEQEDNWSLANLLQEDPDAEEHFQDRFPDLRYGVYRLGPCLDLRLRVALEAADVAIVHEWNEPSVIALLGTLCKQMGVRSVFHDTHYRVVLDDAYRARLGLQNYDEIIAYSPSVAERYCALGFQNVHVVHEAADTTVFRPFEGLPKTQDVVFVGNYGDGDRNEELEQFVFEPRKALPHLKYAVYGVRYPEQVVKRLRNGLAVDYRGSARNVDVPVIYSQSKVVLHVPRRQYVELLPGTPTIRVYEALGAGACLVSLPWPDTEELFRPGDFVTVRTPAEMRDALAWLTEDDAARENIARQGHETILARHTCDHRAEEILNILAGVPA